MLRTRSGEDAFVTRLIGKGSRKGSTLFGRAGDIIQRPPAWAGLAALIAATGRTGRRAALRGSVCYLGAALAHLPIKAIVGRKHPRGAALLQLGPFTSSFPSGHAAADLAFALGVAQELPVLFLPLSGATMAVHWSLVRKRSHYPSDVLAGGVLGIAVAVAAWKLWPPGGSGDDAPNSHRRAERGYLPTLTPSHSVQATTAPSVGYRAAASAPGALPAERTALLVIDPVNDFLSEGGAAWDLTKTTVRKHDVVGHLRQAIDGARRRGIPVLFGPMAFTAEDYAEAQLQRRSGINRLMFERRMFLAGTWGADFHPDLRPEDGDIVLQPHKSIDVFETDLPEYLERLGTTHLVIAGMTANLCCESTGRHAMELGYHVTYLRDAIGADNLAAYETATRVNFPLVANAVVDVDDFFDALDHPSELPRKRDTVRSSDGLKIGSVRKVAASSDSSPGHLRVRKGRLLRRSFHVPLDALTVVGPGQVRINLPKLVIDKMPWGRPPTSTRAATVVPAASEIDRLYASTGPTGHSQT